MKLFLVSLLAIQAVVIYYLDYNRFRDLVLWKDSVLELKYRLMPTTSDSYAPKKPKNPNEDEHSDYSLPMELSSDMQFEDAYQLYNIRTDQSCVPDTFGYTNEQADLVFPYKGYPRCIERYSGYGVPEILVDLDTDTFTIDCKNTTDIEYLMGPAGQFNFASGHESVADLEIRDYKGPVHMSSHIEFIMAKCGKNADFDLAAVWHRKNEKLYKDYTEGKDKNVKPLLIAYLVIDSFSRRHFYQKLPKTVEFLNELNRNSSYEVHDFKLHNLMGDRSAENIVPIMTRQYDNLIIRDQTNLNTRNSYLWNNLADKKFITLIIQEGCEARFPEYFGNKVEAHHVLRQFYCSVQHIGEFSFEKFSTNKQRCIGPHMSHIYGLDYINQFVENYHDANKWFYAHFLAGHEATGQHAETLDLDLRDFLQKLLNFTQDTHNVALFINADHGMRFGEWQKDSSAFQEHKLPVLFSVSSKELLDMIPNSRSTLLTNTWRLNSKKELRRTMQYLSNYPNFKELPQEDQVRNYNLYTEEIDINRKCQDAKIPLWYCSCVNFQDVDLKYAREENPELHYLIKYITDYTVFVLNKESYTGYSFKPGFVCQKIELKSIDRAFAFGYDDMTELIKIQFSVKNKKNASFSVLFLISPRPYTMIKKHLNVFSYGRLESYMYKGLTNYFKIVNLSRLDPFEGSCAVYARKLKTKPDFCFCNEGFEEKFKSK